MLRRIILVNINKYMKLLIKNTQSYYKLTFMIYFLLIFKFLITKERISLEIIFLMVFAKRNHRFKQRNNIKEKEITIREDNNIFKLQIHR